jgi:lysophospholipase L1-like esterase
MPKRRRVNLGLAGLAALAVATAGAVAFAVADGSATKPAPVSSKVQQYYDENVANKKAGIPTTAAKTVAFMGDSYTAGSGTTSTSMRWTTRLSAAEGWTEVNLGRGGSGYLITNTTAEGVVRPNYQTMLAEAVKAKPDVVFVTGGGNDLGLPIENVLPAVADFYPSLRKALPDAVIVAVNPLWGPTPQPRNLPALTDAVKAAVAGVGGTYLDIGQPLKDHPELVVEDKVHPNDAGAKVIADATAAALLTSPASAIAKG